MSKRVKKSMEKYHFFHKKIIFFSLHVGTLILMVLGGVLGLDFQGLRGVLEGLGRAWGRLGPH